MSNRILLESLADPTSIRRLSINDWNAWLNAARGAGLLARCRWRLLDAGVLDDAPPAIQERLEASMASAESHARSIRWEAARIGRALGGLNCPVVLLKGAAYLLSGLEVSRGRLSTDVDILVPKLRLADVESALVAGGWTMLEHDDYDDHYYRVWMHELPPMRNVRRKSVLDVHHNVLPMTGRLRPDAEKLLAASRSLACDARLRVLSPEDMTLHAVVHAFQDGDLASGIRDLLDMDGLLREFGREDAGYWNRLFTRAGEMGLSRPLYYAVRYSRRYLATPAPDPLPDLDGKPSAWVLRRMDALVSKALALDCSPSSFATEWARLQLYVRSHWLRMPPLLLFRHLGHKSLKAMAPRKRRDEATEDNEREGRFAAPLWGNP